jgi:hypothetical protein
MATSPLFGWQEPDDVDLVKDGAAAIRTLGNAIDTSMGDLLGGTSGQILSKNSNTNMDFTWITNDVGDITAVNVTAPITGGGASGAVTIGVSAASTSASGVVQLSDSTSTTSSVLASTPTATKAAYDLAAAAAPASTAVTLTGTQTLTNKTLTAPVIATPKISSTYTAKTASYTFVSGDEGNIFSMNNAATQAFTIPTDATFNFAVGTEINVFWITGAGQPTISAVTPATTTVISTGATSATPKLRVVNSGATCKKLASDSWIIFGDVV